MQERLGLELARYDAGEVTSEVNVISSALHGLRSVFDLMPTEGEEAVGQHRRPARPRSRRRSSSTRRPCARRPARATSAPRAPDGRGRQAVRHLDRPARRQLLPRPGRPARAPTARCAAELRPGRGRGHRGDRRVRRASCASELAPLGREKQAAGRERYAARLAVLPRRQGRPRRDVRLGLRGAGPAGERDARRGRPRSPAPAPSIDEAVAALDADPARSIQGKEAFRDWMQALGRQGHRRAARHPLRHPRAGPPDRVLPRADQRRRHLLHRPERGLHPPGPDVVGGAAGHHRVLHLARGDHRLPRGRARPSPAGRADGGPRRAAQPLAAAAVLGLRPRRGLGALRRAADGRPRLPGRTRATSWACSTARRSARPG